MASVVATRWILSGFSVSIAVIAAVLFLAAILVAGAFVTGLGLLLSGIVFGWIGWRTWRREPLG